MIRMILAAAAAFALVSAVPAFACPDCPNCHKDKVASADQPEKKDADKAAPSTDKKVAGCGCAKDGAGCKCGKDCKCPNCHDHAKAEKKDEKKS